jgi:hypothetical protein
LISWHPQPEPQTRAARFIAAFGWIDLVAGLVPFWMFVARLAGFHFRDNPYPPFVLFCAALLIPAWGAFFVIAGCANVDSFAPVLLLGLPVVPVALLLCTRHMLCCLAVILLVALDLASHLYLLHEIRSPHPTPQEPGTNWWYRLQARAFAVISSVRAARTFHPDGTVLTGTATPSNGHRYPAISKNLTGTVLFRGGSGIDSRFARQWFPRLNAPNLAVRFTNPQSGDRVDLLVLSVGTSFLTALWQLVPFVPFKANPYDYFRNTYSPWIPYHTPEGGPNVRIRIKPLTTTQFSPIDFAGREAALRDAVEGRLALDQPGVSKPVFAVQVRPADEESDWTTVAQFTLDAILPDVDQESFYFQPFDKRRGFEPYTWWTNVRRVVYPASVAARPGSQAERMRRRELSWGQRFALYLNGAPPVPKF